ncbi:hypothetical protein GJAV_G00208360 [Gymnothorax javanicus]|nr:hypothetical protein GJAV_G00208360 [Gymnothorax javanicus]
MPFRLSDNPAAFNLQVEKSLLDISAALYILPATWSRWTPLLGNKILMIAASAMTWSNKLALATLNKQRFRE